MKSHLRTYSHLQSLTVSEHKSLTTYTPFKGCKCEWKNIGLKCGKTDNAQGMSLTARNTLETLLIRPGIKVIRRFFYNSMVAITKDIVTKTAFLHVLTSFMVEKCLQNLPFCSVFIPKPYTNRTLWHRTKPLEKQKIFLTAGFLEPRESECVFG